MTDTFRAMCAELADALAEWRLGGGPPEDTADADVIDRARALLAEPEAQEGACSGCEGTPVASNSPCAVCGRIALTQPVAEEPTDDEIEEWADACSEAPLEEMDPEIHGWRRCFTAKEFSETIRAALARWGRPTPQPEGSDIHYSWELHDAEGEWQAGGSAITLESVRREGNHYLQTYSQDGPHTLIIYQASTIEVVTND